MSNYDEGKVRPYTLPDPLVTSDGRHVRIHLTVYTPAKAAGRVPLILLVNFGGGDSARGRGAAAPPGGPAAGVEILKRGWGYATVGYQDVQPDRANAWTQGVIGLTLSPGQTPPAPDDWGTISLWAWGVSRIMDYLETDPLVNPKQIAVQGHSRLGKTVLWAAAKDERIAAVFSSCAGEMGSALARRGRCSSRAAPRTNGPIQWVNSWPQSPPVRCTTCSP